MHTHQTDTSWPLRPWLLAGFLFLIGLGIYIAIDEISFKQAALNESLAAFLFTVGVCVAFSLEPKRWRWSIMFSVFWGLVLAGIAFWAHGTSDYYSDTFWNFIYAAIAIVIALPLFQTIIEQGRVQLSYPNVHDHAWSDVVSWCVAWLFTGISFLLLNLLAALFDLIGIKFLADLLDQEWFWFSASGLIFGGSLGVLRENQRIINGVQGLVMSILSLLAPVLALALCLFLFALIFTGLQPLWETTKSTTPILLGTAFGSILLINAIIRNKDDEMTENKTLKWSAKILTITIFPLAIIAWISLQQRIGQHGLTPARIWASLCILIVALYGLVYLASPLLFWRTWHAQLRNWNLRLSLFLCLIALLLSIPIVNFGKWSTEDQISRLETNTVSPKEFDFAALAFDFGMVGRTELEKMQGSTNEVLARGAKVALESRHRWDFQTKFDSASSNTLSKADLKIFPKYAKVPKDLIEHINQATYCEGAYCLLFWDQENSSAQLIESKCTGQNEKEGKLSCAPKVTNLSKASYGWYGSGAHPHLSLNLECLSDCNNQELERKLFLKAVQNNQIEIRKVEKRQLFINGKPAGEIFD